MHNRHNMHNMYNMVFPLRYVKTVKYAQFTYDILVDETILCCVPCQYRKH